MLADPTLCVLNRFYYTKIKLHCVKSALGPTVTPFTYYRAQREAGEARLAKRGLMVTRIYKKISEK